MSVMRKEWDGEKEERERGARKVRRNDASQFGSSTSPPSWILLLHFHPRQPKQPKRDFKLTSGCPSHPNI